ncbi:GAF domain-containing protein [Parvularcula sp. ZS-1/3]|uniref:GAF domain-containing protein n=1 Tax=Parvularcula mediterranea TaxID=2732508 RepID=A0A7Y3RJA0_9PROT|nr:GAF domain-containing protein [Parvularcula mediterranea]NNU15093.1 GAF domain-containing protein [Parvularcula mediterranea]
MTDIPIHPEENERLDVLLSTHALGEELWPELDELTAFASDSYGTPIAAVSLVDQDRQFFKSQVGLDVRQTDRKSAFCAHTICEKDPFVVLNAEEDQRFAKNPLVTGAPDIRFYAGAPITINNMPIGSICVIAREPREAFSAEERKELKQLAERAAEIIQSKMPDAA